jgi:hypothetical protein
MFTENSYFYVTFTRFVEQIPIINHHQSMKINLQSFIWLLCLCQAVMFGQSGTIKGTVKFPDATQTILIQLLSSENNSLVKTQLSEADGSFSFNALPIGAYIVLIEDDKFSLYQSNPVAISADRPNVVLANIVLSVNKVNQLGEIIVQKKKPIVENKIDRTVVNVESMITAAGGDAMDVLEKSPGIVVDQNGTITFKGKSGVAVFIDDKPTYLSGTELEAYLKSLPASTLNQIELMTNPPAKYDAAGSAGVINIITKKSKARGFNGSFTSRVSQGKRFNTREGLNLNYLNDKVRIFGNIGYAHNQNKNDLYIYRRFRNEDGSTQNYFDQYSDLKGRANAVNAMAGIDYYLSEKTTLGGNLSGMSRVRNSRSDVESAWSDADRIIDSTIVANNSVRSRFGNWAANLNFRHDFEKGKITADADYLNYISDTDQRFQNFTYLADNSLTGQDESVGYLPSDINIYSFKTDYSRPVKNDGAIEAGYKVSISKTDNIADYNDIISGSEVPDYDMSNHFKYDEIIHAGYVNFRMSYRRFSFQAGLRLEDTESKGHQLGNPDHEESRFSKHYTNLFPTGFVMYKLDSIGDHSLVTSYGKRINRPYYEDLNPFVSPLDRFTFYAGNPYLSPSFTQYVDLSYRYKGYFSTTVSYSYSKDDINETIEINDGIYYSRPGNIGKSRVYSWNANAQIPFAKWLNTNIYTEVTHARYESQLYTQTLNSSGTYWYISVMNQFTFAKGWSAEAMGYYQTEVVSSQFVLGDIGQISIGIQKKIMKDKASIKLSGNDIFNSGIRTGTINNLRLTDATWINKPDNRFVALTFTYSFGKSFQPKDEHDASGADTEKNRVKGN